MMAWIGLLAIVIMAPVTEEIFFRTFLIKGLVKYHSPWIAILVSSILFEFATKAFANLLYEILSSLANYFIQIFKSG